MANYNVMRRLVSLSAESRRHYTYCMCGQTYCLSFHNLLCDQPLHSVGIARQAMLAVSRADPHSPHARRVLKQPSADVGRASHRRPSRLASVGASRGGSRRRAGAAAVARWRLTAVGPLPCPPAGSRSCCAPIPASHTRRLSGIAGSAGGSPPVSPALSVQPGPGLF